MIFLAVWVMALIALNAYGAILLYKEKPRPLGIIIPREVGPALFASRRNLNVRVK